MKKLTKSKSNRLICGICAGVAEYFLIEANVVRLIMTILLIVFPYIVIPAYIIGAFIIPESR